MVIFRATNKMRPTSEYGFYGHIPEICKHGHGENDEIWTFIGRAAGVHDSIELDIHQFFLERDVKVLVLLDQEPTRVGERVTPVQNGGVAVVVHIRGWTSESKKGIQSSFISKMCVPIQ